MSNKKKFINVNCKQIYLFIMLAILFPVFSWSLDIDDNVKQAKEKISMNFTAMDVRAVLTEFADMVGLDLVVSPEVKGNITLRVKDVTWQEALDAILKIHNLTAELNKNILIVLPKNSVGDMSFAPNMYFEIIPIKYARAEDIANILEKDNGKTDSIVSKHGKILYDKRTNYLIVRDKKSNISSIKQLVQVLDAKQKQILIESYIVISTRSNINSLGINWQLNQNNFVANLGQSSNVDSTKGVLQTLLPSSNLSANNLGRMAFGILAGKNLVLNLELAALEVEGYSKILSAHKIITTDRNTAFIKSGEQIPYQTSDKTGNRQVEFKDALLSLEVTPKIADENFINMKLKINKDNPGQRIGEHFAIETNFIQTQVIVKNKDTLVIGGVMNSSQLQQLSKIPFFGDMPLIGNLFKRQEQSSKDFELIIFIRPSIIN